MGNCGSNKLSVFSSTKIKKHVKKVCDFKKHDNAVRTISMICAMQTVSVEEMSTANGSSCPKREKNTEKNTSSEDLLLNKKVSIRC